MMFHILVFSDDDNDDIEIEDIIRLVGIALLGGEAENVDRVQP